MGESPSNDPDNQPANAGTSRIAATVWLWLLMAGLGGFVWLASQDPFLGFPLTHRINLILFGICTAIGVGFTAAIWMRR
jgi:hypothetical protein